MATLRKINICGIRSFGPNEDDVQTIRFHKPMTVILGENGCGKSTIIECLRYLTAQKEPAGKGTFVHDPTLTGRSTVKGFVKLQIIDAKQNRVDLCRQLQCTKTKTTFTQKSLDNVVTRTDRVTKEKQSISNRCVDFTYEVSRIFGVSRAILENVIFCTQEDSLWPLETDQKLKEKFDQIFDSDKYNKCVTKVRDKTKKLRESCKLSDVEIKHLENNKKMAAEKRREIDKTKGQIRECEARIAELNASLEPIQLELKEINEREMEMSKNHTLKETKKAELKQVEDYIAELEKSIGREFEGTDEELKQALANFREELSGRQREMSKLEDRVSEANRQEARLSKELMTEQGRLGQLEKEEEINRERVAERNQSLNALAIQLDMDSFELTQGSEDSVQYLLSKVQLEVKDKEEGIKDLREKHAKSESDMQGLIDELREKAMSTQNEVANKERSIREGEMEMARIKRDLNEIEESVSKLSKVESQLSKANKAIEELQRKVDVDELKGKISDAVRERDRTENRLTEVEETVRVLQQNASTNAELDVQRELMSGKESDIRRLLNKHEDTLKSLLGEVPRTGFKAAVQSHMDKLRRTVKELTSVQTRKERELTELEMKRKHQKEQLRLKEEKLRSIEEEIYEECGSEDFEEVVSALQSQIDELQDIKGTLSSSEFMYQKYIRALRKPQPCCPLCHRDFARANEAQVLVEELTSKVEAVPSKLQENKSSLEEKQRRFNKLLALRSKHEQIVTLKNVTLPKMRSELEGVESALKKTRKELEEVGNQLMAPQTDEAICSSIQGDMALLDQLHLEKKKIGWEVDALESRLGSTGKGAGSLEDSLNEQENLRRSLKATRSLLEELQGKLNAHNEELQVQQGNKNSLMEELSKIQGGAGRKKQLTERYGELQALEHAQSRELDALREELDAANRSLNDMLSRRNVEKGKHASEVDKLSDALRGFQKQLQEIQTANNHIRAYESKGVGRRLESAQATLRKLEVDMREVKAGRERAAKEIGDIKRELSNREGRKRELEDNAKYRERGKRREVLRKEVAALERKCGDINFDAILREKRKLKEQEEGIGRKKASIQGRMGELDVRIEQLEKELAGKMLRNVEAEFQKELTKLVVMKSCVKDLERYAATMEYAMMTYHKQQMTRVNSFIREYWRKIYQGNDIDYIEIQTDAIAATDKRRTYNYKLVQKKEGAFLDMRNRCSAGQKMLASLIIRMALAETFSCNCGILTLDEPTTNLDRKNIKNLARALNDILLAKQGFVNSNFQLIVITHDEDFLRDLMDIADLREYVRVHRNDRGKTRISREVFDGTVPRIGQYSRNVQPEEPFIDYD